MALNKARKNARYLVAFCSRLVSPDPAYQEAAGRMLERVKEVPGFLGFDSVRDGAGAGITLSYWSSVDALRSWGRDPEHLEVQRRGRSEWYASFHLIIAEIREQRESKT